MPQSLEYVSAISALENAPLGVMIVQGRRIQWVNDAFTRILFLSREDVLGVDATEAEGRGLAPLFEDTAELCLRHSDGEVRWLKRERKRLEEAAVDVYYFQDVSALVGLQQERDRLRASVDALEVKDGTTGLLNRNAILQALDSQVTRSRRYHNPLSIVRLTLTAPERAEPDNVAATLLTVAREFKDHLRWADHIGHLDKSQFLLILPETSLTDAERLAATLTRERAAPVAKIADGWDVHFAVAAWQKGDDVRKLLERLA
jgi:GGDEF domain-containing protein